MKIPFIRSLTNALRGIRLGFAEERSFRMHVAAGLLATAASFAFPLVGWQRVAIWFVVMTVLVLELVNSAMERVVDLLKPQLHECARDIKDLMAGAVLIASLFAVLVGLMIFSPSFLLALRAV